MTEQDAYFMERAIALAKKGTGYTSPNPLVGAVIVKDGAIIGEGYHARYGELHAERAALADCAKRGNDARGAVIYVTLEPCCHYGKQPPCTEALIEAGVSKVVVGSADPNALVGGKGIAALRAHGIEVTEGLLRDKCDALNEVFFHYITAHLPYVACKYAMTLDGKIAAFTGDSKWITGEAARRYVHVLRTRYTAIMVGRGTVLADNPELTSHGAGRNPIRIICDSELRTPLESTLVQTARTVRTIFAAACTDAEKIAAFKKNGCEVLIVPKKGAHLDLNALLQRLAELKIDSVFVEGGGTLHYSLFEAGLVQKVYAFIAAKILGGSEAKTPVEGSGCAKVADAFLLQDTCVQKLGDDFLLEGRVCGS